MWDLGAEDPTAKEYALKALRVICTLILVDSLSLQSSGASSSGGSSGRGSSRDRQDWSDRKVSENLADNVSTVLPDHFLYIMSRLIQQRNPTVNQKVQSVRCLREIVLLLRQPDLAKFLPKIISSMDSVLSSPSGKVRAAGVSLTAALCNRLQVEILCENLSSLVVALYPSLRLGGQRSHVRHDRINSITPVVSSMMDVRRHQSLAHLLLHFPPLREGRSDSVFVRI